MRNSEWQKGRLTGIFFGCTNMDKIMKRSVCGKKNSNPAFGASYFYYYYYVTLPAEPPVLG